MYILIFINISMLIQLCTEAPLQQELNFPGGKVKFTPKRIFTPGSNEERTSCYRVLNENGELIVDSDSLKVNHRVIYSK